jgi:hypothetical protein
MPGRYRDRYRKRLVGRSRFDLPVLHWDDMITNVYTTAIAADAPRGHYPVIGAQYTAGANTPQLRNGADKQWSGYLGDYSTDSGSCITETSKSDVIIVADLRHNVSDSVDAGAQIVFRYVDNTHCWRASIFAASGGGVTLRKHNGSLSTIKTYTTPIRVGQDYTMRVHAIGNNIHVYLDDTLILSANDSFQSTATKHGVGGRRSRCYALWILDGNPNGSLGTRNYSLEPSTAGLILDADATDAATMLQTPGGTQCTTGTVVQQWKDKSWARKHLRGSGTYSAAPTTTQPVTVSDGSIDVPKGNGTTLNAMWTYLFPEISDKEWTLMVRVKTPTETDSAAQALIVKQGDYATSPDGCYHVKLQWASGTGHWTMGDYKYSGTSSTVDIGAVLQDDAYHTVTIVRKQTGSDNYLLIRVDGSELGNITPLTWAPQTAGTDSGKLNPQWVCIVNKERSGGDDPSAWYYKRVRMWDRALTGTTLTDAETAIAA